MCVEKLDKATILGCVFHAARKSLHQLKQLYFELKEDVFSSGNKYGYGFDTKKKEQVLLRYFDPEMKMTAITEPKYVIILVTQHDFLVDITSGC